MKILFTDSVHPLLKSELIKEKNICEENFSSNKEEIEKIICGYDGIIIRSRFEIDKHFIDKAKNLKFIARVGSGMENIDVEYANSKRIKCFNASEGNRQAVAEHALGMILSLFNNLNRSDKEIRNGKWKREKNRGHELSGKTIGIIGFGNNGAAFSKVLSGFDVEILSYDKYLEDYKYKSTMEEIYNKADIISLHIPLTEETTYLVNENFINNFEKNFYLINTARGKCVNTKSLVNSMKEGKIKGVCLDVLEYEKTSFEKLSENGFTEEMKYLIDSENTILSPHVAGWTVESNVKISEILFQKIKENFKN
ncbi:MAG: hydroxyacid dehydrogenase [Flavobacteriales bacterium]|jgi:D-3-phosphoglycerate dehydrogenase|nr:hydroxyacid dehydrogenase [Flavobacteriales bacterium]MBT7481470.1 hydroxyacid dehydrogenase [Flavobacteriales bacterium]